MQGYSTFKKKKSKLGTTLLIVAAVHLVAGGGLVWLASTTAGRELLAVYKVTIIPDILNINKAPDAPSPGPSPAPAGPAGSSAGSPAPRPEPAAPEAHPSETEIASVEPDVSAETADPSSSGEALPEETVAGGEGPGGEFPGGEGPEMAMSGPGGPASSPGDGSVSEGPAGVVRLPGFGSAFTAGGGGKGKKFVGYADLVTSEIQRFYKQPAELPENIRLAVRLQLLVDDEGRLLSFKLLTSSGNDTFDQSALQALAGVKQLRPPPAGVSRTIIVKFFPPS